MAVTVRVYVDGRVVELEVPGPLSVFKGAVQTKKQGKAMPDRGGK